MMAATLSRAQVAIYLPGVLLLHANAIQADIGIVARDDGNEVTQFAAAELSKYLDQAAGRKVCGPAGEVTIRVGGEAGLAADADAETLVIDCSGPGIVLSGKSPGATLYAVYRFLEEAVGCRWFYPGEDIVPRLGRSALMTDVKGFAERTDRLVEAPDFSVRMRRFLVYDLGKAGTPIADQAMQEMVLGIDWMAKNRMNIFQFALDHNWDCYTHWPQVQAAIPEMQKRGMVPGMGGHNMHMFMRPEDLEAHPDWMPLYNGERQARGQFCTRNEEAVRHYIDGLITFLEEHPGIGYLAPWPNDMGGWCGCELCKDTPMPDRFMELGKRIHRELAERFPELVVTHFAYGSHMEPPKTERPEPGMIVTLCTWGRDLSQPFDSEGTSAGFRETFATWRDIGRESDVPLILHEKYARHLYAGQHTLPLPVLQTDLRWFREQGLAGFELPMAYMGRRTKGLNLYVLARLMWDVDAPVEEMLNDYFAREYGPLAGTMERAYRRVERGLDDYRYSFHNHARLGTEVKPGQSFSPALVSYCEGAREGIAAALGWVADDERLSRKLADEPDRGKAILSRLDLFRRSLQYYDLEWQGLEAMAAGARAVVRADLAETQKAYLAKLDEAAEAFEGARAIAEQREALTQKVSDLAVFWDVTGFGPSGVFNGKTIDGWLRHIEEKRALDVTKLPRSIWQIGVFDATGAELGDDPDQRVAMLKMPEVVRWEVPDDWAEREDWTDFPRSHWPQSLKHGARIEMTFSAAAGRYQLVVGQMATGEPETVRVLLDSQEVGSYTTVAGKDTTHEVEFDIPADGRHELALAEFAAGGGYMFDALKLERLPG